jgi:hypothetical protein
MDQADRSSDRGVSRAARRRCRTCRCEAITGAAQQHPWASFQRPGDIVLTRGRRPLSHLNAVVQSILEGGIARATHAMMVAAPGFYVDASMRFGVSVLPAHLFCIDGTVERATGCGRRRSARGRCGGGGWSAAFRHPDFASQPQRQQALTRAIAEQLGQPYNLRFIFKRVRTPDDDRSAFCSELVARTFARLGLPIVPERRFAAVLPHTLLRHLRQPGLGRCQRRLSQRSAPRLGRLNDRPSSRSAARCRGCGAAGRSGRWSPGRSGNPDRRTAAAP